MQDNSKIKICIISTIKNAHVIRWCRILSSKEYDIRVISSERDEWNISDINVIECLPVRSKFYANRLFYQLIHAIRIHLILKKMQPDIVHIHSLDYIHPLMFSIVNLITGKSKNLIISTWGTDAIKNIDSEVSIRSRFSKKMLLKQAAEITATSKYLASETTALSPPGKHIHVIPFGIDCNLFNKKAKKATSNEICIGFIKHLKPKYGPEYLIRSLVDIAPLFPEIKLIMIGHGKMEYDLKELAINLGVKEKIQFLGYIQNENLPPIMENIDIFVMPSTENETFGVAAVEAQAMEIPVVASDVGGVSEAILDGKSGILVEPKNVKQLSNAILKLIKNPEQRERMGKAGREFVLSNYNLEKNVKLVENLYRKLS